MHEELVGDLRYCDKGDCNGCRRYTKDTRFCNTLLREAADAIEELSKRADEWETLAESWKKACEGLENRMPRWIPVTEKNHPKAYEPVMVIYIGCHDALPHRDCTAYWSEEEGPWRWAETNDKVNVTITHYMPLPPLPEPPKEET